MKIGAKKQKLQFNPYWIHNKAPEVASLYHENIFKYTKVYGNETHFITTLINI